MTEERTGYTTRDVTTLSNAQLIEEALQSGYTSGFYAAAQGAASLLHIEARNRRNATFAEIKRRLAQAERLAEVAQIITHATMYNGVYEVSAADMGNLHKALAAWQGKEE